MPYFAYGRARIRVGDEDRQLSAVELRNLILKRNKNELRWDYEVCKGAKLSDISDGASEQDMKNETLIHLIICVKLS